MGVIDIQPLSVIYVGGCAGKRTHWVHREFILKLPITKKYNQLKLLCTRLSLILLQCVQCDHARQFGYFVRHLMVKLSLQQDVLLAAVLLIKRETSLGVCHQPELMRKFLFFHFVCTVGGEIIHVHRLDVDGTEVGLKLQDVFVSSSIEG